MTRTIFTLTIDDPDEADRLENDLRRQPRIYTRTNGSVNPMFELTAARVIRTIHDGSATK